MRRPGRGGQAALHAMDQWVDPLLFFLAATSIPMLIVQAGGPTDDDIRLITRASWVIWGAFTANFVVRLVLAVDRRAQLRLLAFDLVLIVGQPLYSIGDRQADAVVSFLRLVVIGARSLERGRVLRRTGHKLRSQPLRIVAFIVPFLWLTSSALIYRTETESGVIGSFGDGLWWSAVTMATVGYGDISPKTTAGRGVAIGTMIIGIGMFSLITAKLAEALFVQRTRGSRREVIETDHTLVLGWSPKVFTIVEQLVIANASRRRASIVVLAERDHSDMFDDIAAHVPSLTGSTTTLVTRTGSPSDPTDLAICRPDRARSIIVIDDTEEDASVVRSVLALVHSGAPLPEQVPVVAEIDSPATAAALRVALDGRVTIVNANSFIARTAAQACRSAGIALAYHELLGFEGAELYAMRIGGIGGRRFADLLVSFPDACLIGHRPANGVVRLNPDGDTVIAPDDDLVLLAEDDSGVTYDAATDPVQAHDDAVADRTPEHIVIFGWNLLGPRLVRELDGFAPPGSRVTVALDPSRTGGIEQDDAWLADLRIAVRMHKATDSAYADLVSLIADEDADHAIVLCTQHGCSVAEADAHALVTTLQVRRALDLRGRETTLVTELLDQRDVSLAPPSAAGDFIVSDRLVSLLLTQLAENAHLSEVFDDLLDPEGAELHCKPASRYCRPGEPTTFAAITRTAAAHGESAIGWRRVADALDSGRGFGAVLNPRKDTPVTLDPADQVIVVANR